MKVGFFGGAFDPFHIEHKNIILCAKEELGLNIVKPSEEQYALIKKIYDDINEELLFSRPFSISEVNGAYAIRRCLLESVTGGADYFATEGVVFRGKTADGQIAIQNRVNFEGWRHDMSSDKIQLKVEVEDEEVTYESSTEYQT